MSKQSPYSTFLLILLMLISNIGISMDTLWCHCTKQLQVGLFTDVETDLACCKHNIAPKATSIKACCNSPKSKTTCTKTTSSNSNIPQITKKCCTNSSHYLTLDQAHTQDVLSLDLSAVLIALPCPRTITVVDFQEWILPTLYSYTVTNKAPPLLSGRQLLQAIQRYIC